MVAFAARDHRTGIFPDAIIPIAWQLERIFRRFLEVDEPRRPVNQAIGEILVGMDDALRIRREVARILQEHGHKIVPDIVSSAPT